MASDKSDAARNGSRQPSAASAEGGASEHFVPLATMTQCPPVVRARIERPRLISRLTNAVEARLVLIKAPAGFGKTTLAVDWSDALRAGSQCVAWLRAEREINEPSIFLHYLGKAIEQACPGTGAPALDLMSEGFIPPNYAILTAMVNALAESGEELSLFIDDYHLIETPEIHQLVWFLLQHAPRHFRIVLTAREEPPLPLGSMHASGELLEIDAVDLRFSLEETRRLFGSLEQVQSSEAELNDLQRESGGWPAALRIASSSLRAGVTGAECLRSRRGSAHAVEAYLNEILVRLPAEIYDFMLASSILRSPMPELCNELMGIDNGEEVLETLFHHYQFLNPETREPGAYCYHPLIADHLQRCLKREAPKKLKDLHRKAAGWYARHDRMVEAIEHAVSANDCEIAAAWTEQCAMRLIKEGKVRTVLSWRRWLPKELMRAHLPLRLALGWSLVLAAEREDALTWIDEIEADIAAGTPDPDGVAAREVLAIRAAIVGLSDKAEAAFVLGQRYMQDPLEDPWITNSVGNCLAFAHIMSGRHEEVDRMPWLPMAPGSYVRASSAQIYRLCLTGIVLVAADEVFRG